MTSARDDAQQLERLLLRRGVGALEADRHRCADCGRTPLIGEQVYLYAAVRQDERPRSVCELCRCTRREAPIGVETVRHGEHARLVRLTRAA